MFYLIANWKANKTKSEAIDWLTTLQDYLQKNSTTGIQIIIAAPFIWLDALSGLLGNTRGVSLCAQYVSDVSIGSFTGEMPAQLLRPLVIYSLIGHSERRRKGETQEIVMRQFHQAAKSGIIPILCVRDDHDSIPTTVDFVAYEPVSSIHTKGVTTHAPALESIIQMKKTLNLDRQTKFFYGGSVGPDSIGPLASSPEIDGLLIGTDSLAIEEFIRLVQITAQTRAL